MSQFTAAEIALYERRMEEGYDLKTDDKYNAWLKLQDTASMFICSMHYYVHIASSLYTLVPA